MSFVFLSFCTILELSYIEYAVPAGKILILAFSVCAGVSRLQDAVSLVSLFHMVHPHSESAREAASQQATGTDLLKVVEL